MCLAYVAGTWAEEFTFFSKKKMYHNAAAVYINSSFIK
jgi:hypothetical protein